MGDMVRRIATKCVFAPKDPYSVSQDATAVPYVEVRIMLRPVRINLFVFNKNFETVM